MVKKINEFKELQKKKGKKGFSMIELIIVLAIMAILVALIGTQLIPYLEKSREKRDMTTLDTCKTAFESVVADYELSFTSAVDLGDLNSEQVEAFEKYAGLKSGEKPFKSDAADKDTTTVADVQFEYNTDGVLKKVSVNSGKLYVETQKSGS